MPLPHIRSGKNGISLPHCKRTGSIPKLEAKEFLATVEGYEDFVKAVTFIASVTVSFEEITGGSQGFFSPTEKRIVVPEGMGESQTLKKMVHETAHCMLYDKEVNKDILAPAKDGNTKEVETGSIVFTVCQHLGIILIHFFVLPSLILKITMFFIFF